MKTLLIAFLTLAAGALAAAPTAAPAFTTRDLQGRTWTQVGAAHGVMLVDFWASWCVPCLEEIPTLNALAAKYAPAGKVTVLGLNLDKGGAPAVLAAAKKYKVAYPVGPVDTKVADAFGVQGMPTAFVVKGGKVLATLTGKHSLAEFERDLAPYLR